MVAEQQPRDLFTYYYGVALVCPPHDCSRYIRIAEMRRLHVLIRRLLESICTKLEVYAPRGGWSDSRARWRAYTAALDEWMNSLYGKSNRVSLRRFNEDMVALGYWPSDLSKEDCKDALGSLVLATASKQVEVLTRSSAHNLERAHITKRQLVACLLSAPFCLPECPITEEDLPEDLCFASNQREADAARSWRIMSCILVLCESLDQTRDSAATNALADIHVNAGVENEDVPEEFSEPFRALCNRPPLLIAHDTVLSNLSTVEALQSLVICRQSTERASTLVPRDWLSEEMQSIRVCEKHNNEEEFACPCMWHEDTVFAAICAIIAVVACAFEKGREWLQLKEPLSFLAQPLNPNDVAKRFVEQLKQAIDKTRARRGLPVTEEKPHVCVLWALLPALQRTKRAMKAYTRVIGGSECRFDVVCTEHEGSEANGFLELFGDGVAAYCHCDGDLRNIPSVECSVSCEDCSGDRDFETTMDLSSHPDGALYLHTPQLNTCVAVFSRVVKELTGV